MYHGNHKATLLGRALFAEQEDIARKLLAAGADANELSYTEWNDYYRGHQSVEGTPLELALRGCKEAETIKLLLDQGAKPTKKALIASFNSVYGRTEKNKSDIIRLLIKSPLLPPECFDSQILDLSISYQQHWCVDIMIEKGLTPTADMMRQVAEPRYLETAKLLITKLPALANEQFMALTIKQKNFELVHWLVKQNPSLKTTPACQKLLAETQTFVAEKETLIATLRSN